MIQQGLSALLILLLILILLPPRCTGKEETTNGH